MASAAAPKVPVYSGNDLKTTTDDALAPYLATLPEPYKFAQDHSRSNVRFALGYTGVLIAGFTFYADRRLGWEATRSPWIIAAVASYFILNSLLTYWVWAVEAGEVFRGKRKTGETIIISSSVKKYSPLYKLQILYKSPTNKVLQEKELEAPFMNWFSADGVFHPDPLRRWLANEVDILRLAASELVGQEAEGSQGSQGNQSSKRRK